MLGYAILMFLVAATFAIVAVAIYKGKTNLIHNYHQTNVTDKAAYGKAFGKALSVVAIAPLLSGMVGLLGESEGIVCSAVVVLIVGITIGIICIYKFVPIAFFGHPRTGVPTERIYGFCLVRQPL